MSEQENGQVAELPPATVVDSPLPTSTTPSVPETKPTEQTSSQTTEPTEGQTDATPADPMKELADSVGLDPKVLEGFKDVDTAREAVNTWLDNQVSRGNSYQFTETPAPQQPPPPVAVSQEAPKTEPTDNLDLAALGLEENDPAAKAIRALEQRQAKVDEQIQQMLASNQSVQDQQRLQQAAVLQQEANTVIDGWGSTTYGVEGHRNPIQRAAVERVQQLFNALTLSEWQDQQHIPENQRTLSPLGSRLQKAKWVFEREIGGGSPTAPSPTPERKVLNETSSPTELPNMNIGYAKAWSQSPEMKNALANMR